MNEGQERMVNCFQLVAGHLALDFANTLDWRFDPTRRVDLIQSYQRFLEFAAQSGAISPCQQRRLLMRTSKRVTVCTMRRVAEVRELIDRIFRTVAAGDLPSAAHLKDLSDLLGALRLREVIVRRGAELTRSYHDVSERPDGPLWPIVDGAARLLTSGDLVYVRECSNPMCRWLFLDSSKNQSRKWCSMNICGNRAKVRRFRARA